jgi:opacity protein-like surface antigen
MSMPPLAQKSFRIAALTLGALLLSVLALGQTPNHPTPTCKALIAQPNPLPTHKPTPCRTGLHRPDTSISLGAFPQLTATRLSNSPYYFNTESMAPSAGTLGTFRQTFSPWLGYSLNMGYTRATERATDNLGPQISSVRDNLTLPANVYELSLSYIAEKHVTPRLSPFAEVGAGMLAFLPDHSNGATIATSPFSVLNASVTFRPLGVGGVGFDYALTHHLSLRAEYRGQLYKFADYGNALPKYLTVTSEPTISVVYNFTHPK